MGVDQRSQAFAGPQRALDQRHRLRRVQAVARVHQQRGLAVAATVQEDVVRRQPAALEDREVVERGMRHLYSVSGSHSPICGQM